jgi:hypothetical protein
MLGEQAVEKRRTGGWQGAPATASEETKQKPCRNGHKYGVSMLTLDGYDGSAAHTVKRAKRPPAAPFRAGEAA